MKTVDIYTLEDGTIVECVNCGRKDVREMFKPRYGVESYSSGGGQSCPQCKSSAIKLYKPIKAKKK